MSNVSDQMSPDRIIRMALRYIRGGAPVATEDADALIRVAFRLIGNDDSIELPAIKSALSRCATRFQELSGQVRIKRFSHEHYGKLIDLGPPLAGLAEEAKQVLGDRYGGGFIIRKTEMRNPSKNGWFELRILPGYVNNEVCSTFRVELHQFPEDGAQVPVIRYPPISGDKNLLHICEDLEDVPSMSMMMRASILKGVRTPAVVFELSSYLRNIFEPISPWEDE